MSLQGRRADPLAVVKRLQQRLRRRFVLPVSLFLTVLLLQPEQSRFHARMNGVLRRKLERTNHGKPPVARQPASNGVGRRERIVQFTFEIGQDGHVLLPPELGMDFPQSLY